MVKRPPKPEGVSPAPRFIPQSEKRSLSRAIEASRRLISRVDFSYDAKELVEMDDRAIAVLRGVHIENMLQIAIRYYIRVRKEEERDIFRGDGLLGNFARKISLAYAVDMFGKTTKDNLEITRTIRNVFAHSSGSVDFESKEIKNLCAFYKYPMILQNKEDIEKEMKAIRKNPKREFITATIQLELGLGALARRKANKIMSTDEIKFDIPEHKILDLSLP